MMKRFTYSCEQIWNSWHTDRIMGTRNRECNPFLNYMQHILKGRKRHMTSDLNHMLISKTWNWQFHSFAIFPTVNYKALLISMGVIAGVLLLSCSGCILYCCCCRGPSGRQRRRYVLYGINIRAKLGPSRLLWMLWANWAESCLNIHVTHLSHFETADLNDIHKKSYSSIQWGNCALQVISQWFESLLLSEYCRVQPLC